MTLVAGAGGLEFLYVAQNVLICNDKGVIP